MIDGMVVMAALSVRVTNEAGRDGACIACWHVRTTMIRQTDVLIVIHRAMSNRSRLETRHTP